MKFSFIDIFSDAKYRRSVLGGLVCGAVTVGFPIVTMTRGALHNINVLGWDERILINMAVVFGAIIAGAAYKTVSHFPSEIKEKESNPKDLKELLTHLKSQINSRKAFLLLQTTVFLNTASAVLCKRISVTEIGKSHEIELIVSTAGLVIFAAGGLLLGLSVINRPLHACEKVVAATQGHASGGNGSGNKSNGSNGSNGTNGSQGKNGGNASSKQKQGDVAQTGEEQPAQTAATSKALPLVQYPELSAWLIIIGSIALVENAWMPLLSLPGILVGMKWYLHDVHEKGSAVQFAGDGAQLNVPQARWKIVPYIY